MLSYWFGHIHLVSHDPLKAAEFYEEMFNAKRVNVRELGVGRVSVGLDIKGIRLMIMSARDESQSAEDSPKKRYGLEHFGLYTDNLDAAVANLKAKGVRFVEEISVGSAGSKIAFLMAPDNVMIELVENSS
ncbi:VOC family protein [Chloroflexota bacterium]